MQGDTLIPHGILERALLALAGLIVGGGGVRWYIAWIASRRQKVEETESEARNEEAHARTRKTNAEATGLELQQNVTAAEILLRVMEQLSVAHAEAQKLRIKLADYTRMEQECKILSAEVEVCRAIIHEHNLQEELAEAHRTRETDE